MSNTVNVEATQVAEVPAPIYSYRVPSAMLGASVGGLSAWAAISAFPQLTTLLKGKHHYLVFSSMALFGGALLAKNYNRVPTVSQDEEEKK